MKSARPNRPSVAEGCGFTVIELLVVVAIVLILSALLLSSLSRAKVSASSAKCKSNLRQIGLALNLYVSDFEKYPRWYQGLASADEVTGRVSENWDRTLLRYGVLSPRMFDCPASPFHWDGGTVRVVGGPVWLIQNLSYAYNIRGTEAPSANDTDAGLGLSFGDVAVPESNVRVPSEMVAIGELDGFAAGFSGTITSSSSPNDPFYRRHGKFSNAIFCDDHVEAADLWQIPHQLVSGSSDQWKFKPDEARARRLNNDHESHAETWAR